MPGRKVFRPVTQKFGEREIYRNQEKFDNGLMRDPPASDIPDTAMARLTNAVAYPEWIEGRRGSKVWSSIGYPAITGRTGYSLTLSGTTVTRSNGTAFSQSDVSNYIVFDDGTHYEITAFISATQVTVDLSGDKTASAGYLRGRVNANLFHSKMRKIVKHIGNEIFVAEDINITGWTRVIINSYRSPTNATSVLDELDDDAILITSNGIFRIYLDTSTPIAFKINDQVPNISITDVVRQERNTFCRRYLYSMSRLNGNTAIYDRTTSGVKILQESGTNGIRYDLNDYGEVWRSSKWGDDTKTKGRLVGANVTIANRDAGGVWAPIVNGSVIFDINGNARQIFVDFTGVLTMEDVADRIQTAARAFFPDMTCEWDDTRFIITSGDISGTTLSWCQDGVGGTNIADDMLCRLGDGGTLDTAYLYERSRVTESLNVAVDNLTPTVSQWQWTHYSVYATLDCGPAGTDPVTGIANNPERYMWLGDVRIAGAFLASKTSAGLVTATYGTFEQRDEGSILEWENGDRDTITDYISATQVMVDVGGDPDYAEALVEQAAAIGNGNVRRASQSGNTVTLTTVYNSEVFTSADVGKSIFWANGTVSYITAVASGGASVTVHDSQTKLSQGITIDPTHRKFNDTTNDDTLRIRRNSSQYLLRQRFWEAIPAVNIGRVVPGFLFAAVRGGTDIYYSQLPPTQKYLAGCHNPFHQTDESCKDPIVWIDEFPDRLVAFCKTKTYGGATNKSIEVNVADKVGERVIVFGGLQIVDSNIGITDYGSIQKPEQGVAVMITSEPAVRTFDGYSYGPNLAESNDMESVMNVIRNWQHATASAYDPRPSCGYIVWGKQS